MHRKCRVDCRWTSELAYAIGVITTDGNLSPSGRHINITSRDLGLLRTLRKILVLENKIGRKARGGHIEKKYYVLQFGDINFYKFLLHIGLTPAKSRTIGELLIPDDVFPDFLRGCIDGDGTIGAFTHPESRNPQIRVRLVSASPKFLWWILGTLRQLYELEGGHVYAQPTKSVSVLSFGIRDSIKILRLMYYRTHLPALARKRRLAERFVDLREYMGRW